MNDTTTSKQNEMTGSPASRNALLSERIDPTKWYRGEEAAVLSGVSANTLHNIKYTGALEKGIDYRENVHAEGKKAQWTEWSGSLLLRLLSGEMTRPRGKRKSVPQEADFMQKLFPISPNVDTRKPTAKNRIGTDEIQVRMDGKGFTYEIVFNPELSREIKSLGKAYAILYAEKELMRAALLVISRHDCKGLEIKTYKSGCRLAGKVVCKGLLDAVQSPEKSGRIKLHIERVPPAHDDDIVLLITDKIDQP